MRKAQSSAVPRKWIKAYKDVLETPTWKFVDRIVIDGVQYVHGEGGTAHFKVFGCQVGCGIDFDSYAMAYAKRGKKPAIACAVVIGGHTCINELMNL